MRSSSAMIAALSFRCSSSSHCRRLTICSKSIVPPARCREWGKFFHHKGHEDQQGKDFMPGLSFLCGKSPRLYRLNDQDVQTWLASLLKSIESLVGTSLG